MNKNTRVLKAAFASLSAILLSVSAFSQVRVNDFYFETRLGYEVAADNGEFNHGVSGFHGSWLNMRLDGQITDKLTYSYRQRFTKGTTRNFFDATDWIHLDWQATDWLTIGGGKQVVAIGGYEYDRAPIDLYSCSEFWNNIACYQFGVSASAAATENDTFLLQLCNSPMRGYMGANNKVAINLMWYGSHGFYETMWSVNAFQNNTKEAADLEGTSTWMYYLALGNRFNFTDWLRLDVDYMNRMAACQTMFKDFSIMAELSAAPCEAVRIHAKYTIDYNDAKVSNDHLVMLGTQLHGISGGIEYFPVKSARNAVKLFALGGYYLGENGNPAGGEMVPGSLSIQAGVKFRLDILEGIRTLINRQ